MVESAGYWQKGATQLGTEQQLKMWKNVKDKGRLQKKTAKFGNLSEPPLTPNPPHNLGQLSK